MRDHTSSVVFKRVLSPVSVSDNTALVGQIIDRQGYDALTYAILTGSIADADATFTVLLEEGNESNLSDAAAIADADMISQNSSAPETGAAFQFDDDNEVRKIGYRGNMRYSRLTVTPVNNASAAVLAAVAILSAPENAPVTQPAA